MIQQSWLSYDLPREGLAKIPEYLYNNTTSILTEAAFLPGRRGTGSNNRSSRPSLGLYAGCTGRHMRCFLLAE